LNSSALPARSRTDHDQVIRQKSPAQLSISAPVISTAILRIRIDGAPQAPYKDLLNGMRRRNVDHERA
jgi:hypothetical protein